MSSVESIRELLKHLHKRIARLRTLSQYAREEYYASDDLRDSVDHNFQLVIEACTDVGAVMLGLLGQTQPPARRGIFEILGRESELPEDLASFLAGAVGLRNILVHRYLTIDPEKMYTYLQDDIGSFERFEAFTLAWIKNHETPGPPDRKSKN